MTKITDSVVVNGKRLRILDALTEVVKYRLGYAANALLVKLTDKHSLTTTFERDTSGALTAIVSPFGQRTSLTTNADGYITSITNPAAETIVLDYWSDGLLRSKTDARGNTHRYFYDSRGRLIRDENAAGGFKTISRKDTTNAVELTVATAEGRVSKYMVERLSNGDTRLTNTDASGLKTVTVDGTNGTKTITTPNGTVITRTDGPDPRFGMQAPVIKNMTIKLPSGLQKSINQGWRVTQMSGLAVTGLVDSMIVNGSVFRTIYDDNQNLTRTISAEGRQEFTFTDNKGLVIKDSIPGFAATNYKYDSNGNIIELSQNERKQTYTYDPNGRVAAVTDPQQRTTSFVYDSVGRIRIQTLPGGREVRYTYDANGQLASISPPTRPAHSFNYTPIRLTQSYAPPDSGIGPTATHYSYNLDGQLKRITRPDSSVVEIEYGLIGCGCASLVGRPMSIMFDRGVRSFASDTSKGVLTRITDPDGNTLTYTYDGTVLRRETWSGQVGGNVEVSYDNNFRVINQTINGANAVAFAYDKDGLLRSAGALKIFRDANNGLIKNDTVGNVVMNYSYNNFGELASLDARIGTIVLFQTNYQRDALSRISQLTETIQGETRQMKYTYDATGRLTEVQRNDTLISVLTYDANGNRLSHTSLTGTTAGSYDVQDRLLTYGNVSYSYSADGQLVSKAEGPDTTRYTYDHFGNLVKVVLTNGDVIEYLIDGQNRRIGKKVNGSLLKKFLYEGQMRVTAELDTSGNVIARYVYAEKVNVPEYVVKDNTIYRIITDDLGSVRLIVNASTSVAAQRIDYDEFGNVVSDSNPDFTPFGFAGGLYDPATKLVRFGARDYDATIGRWTAKDPNRFDSGDLNLYSYGKENPINNTDPYGLFRTGNADVMAQQQVALSVGQSIAGSVILYEAWCNTLTQDSGPTIFRVHGGILSPWYGKSWTTHNPFTAYDYRSQAGLPDANTGELLSVGQLKDFNVTFTFARPAKPGQIGGSCW